MVKCLKTRPAFLLVDKTGRSLYSFEQLPSCLFSPVIEKRGKKPFLAGHPYNLLKQGKLYDVPWIVAVTKDDGVLSIKNTKWEPVKKNFVYYDINGPDDIQKRVETYFHTKKFWDSLGFLEYNMLISKKDEL
ncbi:unnamed protein product [Acanthoscelides obtectus]|uniref:Carboxylesterase type B domain-containing protein n=1 Tax=Acanthoscelides obtectus TaxID=200917 RepID=A0A9P0P5E5_ACAOB|nr:unnamed protein product [Acanthoscelides obtectus]CAK1656397.1 hypothetical protein AOBTE_LOCUS19688 [Acanthoscelides obtectus]